MCRSTSETQQDGMLEPQPGARCARTVQRRDPVRTHAAQNIRISRLPVPVVTLGDKSRCNRIKRSRAKPASAFVEVTRVLLKNRLYQHVANENVVYPIRVVGSKALRKTLYTFAIARVAVSRLLDSCADTAEQNRHGIDEGLPAQFKLLLGRESSCIGLVGHEKVRKHTEYALFLLRLHLLGSQFVWWQTDIYHG